MQLGDTHARVPMGCAPCAVGEPIQPHALAHKRTHLCTRTDAQMRVQARTRARTHTHTHRHARSESQTRAQVGPAPTAGKPRPARCGGNCTRPRLRRVGYSTGTLGVIQSCERLTFSSSLGVRHRRPRVCLPVERPRQPKVLYACSLRSLGVLYFRVIQQYSSGTLRDGRSSRTESEVFVFDGASRPTSAPRLGPHLRRDSAHICAATRPTSAPRLAAAAGQFVSHQRLRTDGAHAAEHFEAFGHHCDRLPSPPALRVLLGTVGVL